MNRPLLAETVDHCDAIFYLAAAVGVCSIVESPVRTMELLLELAAKKRKKVLL